MKRSPLKDGVIRSSGSREVTIKSKKKLDKSENWVILKVKEGVFFSGFKRPANKFKFRPLKGRQE